MLQADLLRIYLNDHLALAKGAEELAERSRDNNHGTDLGRSLAALAGGFRDDQEMIRGILASRNWMENPVKEMIAWLAEKAGRMKLNDRLVGYSDLSRVEELQALLLALQGMEVFWGCLEAAPLAAAAGLPVGEIAERRAWAAEKRAEVEDLHREAALKAFLAEAHQE